MKIIGSCQVKPKREYGLQIKMSPESKPEYVCIVWRDKNHSVIGMTKPGKFLSPAKAFSADFVLSIDQKNRARLMAYESVAKIIHHVLKKAAGKWR